MVREIIAQIKEVPEYLIALKGALAVFAMGLPIYAGLRYFLHRRRLQISIWVTLNFIAAFILFAVLAFLLASPLADKLPSGLISAYLFITCVWAALGAVSLIDVFFIGHYLINVKRFYISPPLRTVIKLIVFSLALLPILRFVLRFNPLALVAIPTIATAGIAFAFQDTFKAFIAGVGLGHMVRIGQWVTYQDKEGRVLDINWTRTTLEMADGRRVYIPNSLLLSGVFMTNPAGATARFRSFKITVAFDIPPERVKDTLLRAINGTPGVSDSPKPLAMIANYADSGLAYNLAYAVDEIASIDKINDEVSARVWHALHRAGIAIAYPVRHVDMNGSSRPTKSMRSKKSL